MIVVVTACGGAIGHDAWEYVAGVTRNCRCKVVYGSSSREKSGGLWWGKKFVRDSSKWLEPFQTTRINRGNKFSLAIE